MESTTRMAPPSPLKIPTHDYEVTPSSSTTSSPAESCASHPEKSLEPWEKMTSPNSSINSSVTSEPIWEEDSDGSEGYADEEVETETSTVQQHRNGSVNRMQTLVQTMQQRLLGLQRLMEEGRPQRRQWLEGNAMMASSGVTQTALSHVTEDNGETAPAQPSASVEDPPANDASTDKTDSPEDGSSLSSSSTDGGEPPAMTTLLDRIKSLQAQLEAAADENRQLRGVIRRLEDENARLRADDTVTVAATIMSGEGSINEVVSTPDREASDASEDLDFGQEDFSRLTTAIFGKSSDFQLVMEQDLLVLKNHERCQHKLHELWDTIRTLRTFVETYEVERDAMRAQRDEAIADADRADSENAKLAGSSNTQQKIKYLQQVKSDNQALRRKNRALNAKIAKLSARIIQDRNGYAASEQDSFATSSVTCSISEDTMTLEELQSESDDRPERTRPQVLKSMWDHSEMLQRRLERLRLVRQELGDAASSACCCEQEDQDCSAV